MTTIRRELRTKFEEVLARYADKLTLPEREPLAESLADVALGLRGFAMLATDEERPAYGLDWKLGHGEEVTQHDLDAARKADQGPKMFERAFGFGSLPWDSTPEWTNLRKFVTEIYARSPLAFGNYIVWRAGDGKYSGMSNKQIRLNPKVFMDTGWPEFEKVTTTEAVNVRPEYQLHKTDDTQEKYVPNPKRPVLHKQAE